MAMIERDDRELVVCPRCNGDMSMPATRAAIFCHDPVPAVRSLLSKPSPLTDDEWIRKQAAEEDGCFVGAGSPSTGNPLIQIPNCPKCGNPLEKVRQSSNSPLNEEQFDSVRAGDWFCKCHSNERGNKPWAYFWDSEVLQSETSSTIEDKVHAIMTAGVGDVGVDHFYGKQVATQADLLHQADGDDFPEPHMEAQPDPEESPELAQSVATGERKQGHSALRLDKDAQKFSMFDPHPKQEPDNDLLDSICREMFECGYAHLTDPIKCDLVIRSYLQACKPCADDPHWDYCKWGENCNCGHPLIDHVPGKTCLGCGNSIYACKEFKLRGWVAFKGEPETIDSMKLRIAMRELKATRDNNAQLRSQLRNWETWGTVEIAVRNPNVDSYMKHWEGRALAAEEKVAELEGRIANALL